MFKLFICSLISLLVHTTHAETPVIRLAVIDTAVHQDIWLGTDTYHLCSSGHRDFTGLGTSVKEMTHGTQVIHTITKWAHSAKYCIILVNAFNHKNNTDTLTAALQYVATLDIDIINVSAGGPGFNNIEAFAVKTILDKGITFVAAAGNEGTFLTLQPYFPAVLDSRILVVANRSFFGSNVGPQVDYIVAEPELNAGTSMAAAQVTGRLIKRVSDKLRYYFD